MNGIITAPRQVISSDADVVQFQIWLDGRPTTVWRPFQFGDARPPVPPIPTEAAASVPSQGTYAFVGGTSARPAAVPRHQPAHAVSFEERYTVMDTDIGVQNRPKPTDGSDDVCLADALIAVPRRGTPLSAKVIARPLHGLYLPQVIVSRVTHQQGWQTIAIDLRSIGLGIKIANVRLGASIRQLLAYDSPLQIELTELGRGDIDFAFQLNLDPCPIDAAFHVRVDTLTILRQSEGGPPLSAGISHASMLQHTEPSQAAPARWARRFPQGAPRQAINIEDEVEDKFTVFDTVHHFRVLRRARDDSTSTLIARALSATPELPNAEGHLLLHGVAELPWPQIVLAVQGSVECIVPLLYQVAPAIVCTTSVPPGATAFEVAYFAQHACRALRGAHNQVASRTAAITGHHGSTEPFRYGCAVTHEALVLRGFRRQASRNRRHRDTFGAPDQSWIEARVPDERLEGNLDHRCKIRIFVARGHPGAVHVDPTATLKRDC